MKEVVKKEILHDLTRTIQILEQKEAKDIAELNNLSKHSIANVAAYKDLDLISITVLIYSLYKIFPQISKENCKDIIAELKFAKKNLEQKNLSRYNRNIKTLYNLIRKSNAKVKTHLQDVMQAARIKKSAELLQRGLSIGQAAGLMGLSNWDLQQYVGKTTFQNEPKETVSPKKRVIAALKIFGVK